MGSIPTRAALFSFRRKKELFGLVALHFFLFIGLRVFMCVALSQVELSFFLLHMPLPSYMHTVLQRIMLLIVITNLKVTVICGY